MKRDMADWAVAIGLSAVAVLATQLPRCGRDPAVSPSMFGGTCSEMCDSAGAEMVRATPEQCVCVADGWIDVVDWRGDW